MLLRMDHGDTMSPHKGVGLPTFMRATPEEPTTLGKNGDPGDLLITCDSRRRGNPPTGATVLFTHSTTRYLFSQPWQQDRDARVFLKPTLRC